MRKYKDILFDVAISCKEVFYHGYTDNYSDVIKAATDIYIAELKAHTFDNWMGQVRYDQIKHRSSD